MRVDQSCSGNRDLSRLRTFVAPTKIGVVARRTRGGRHEGLATTSSGMGRNAVGCSHTIEADEISCSDS